MIPNRLFHLFATFLLAGSLASAQEAAPAKSKKTPASDSGEPEIGVLVELFRLDHRTANQLVTENAGKAADAGFLRKELGKLLAQEKVALVETAWVRSKNGQRAQNKSIRELIYPTEYDPPEIPAGLDPEARVVVLKDRRRPVKPGDDLVYPMTSATPAAFETRDVGTVFEIDPALSDDRKTVELNLSIELVSQLEDEFFTREGREETARGVDHIKMPTFYSMRTTCQISTVPGQYNLVAIQTPHENDDERILVLVRTDLIPIR